MRDQAGEAAVKSVDIVPFNVVVDLAVNGVNYRCSEDAYFDAVGMQIEPDSVERTPHVEPVGRSDDSLVAKTEHLAAGDEIDPAFGRAAKLHVSLPNIPDVLVGRRGSYVVIEKVSRILCYSHQLEPTRGLDINSHAELSQIIDVVDGGVAESILAFNSIAKLSAELDPMGKKLV